jgi:hypothetical protein
MFVVINSIYGTNGFIIKKMVSYGGIVL